MDAGDVGTGGERADLQVTVGVALEDLFQVGEVGEAVRATANDLHVAVAFVPGCLVGMVFHVSDDHQGLLAAAARKFAAILLRDP